MELIVFTQIKEEAKESGKTGFVDFKRVVWHECFKKMLETLKYSEAEGGFWVNCSDRQSRLLCPFIIILSADFEEQYVCALISMSFVFI